jgi:hypothetical protein
LDVSSEQEWKKRQDGIIYWKEQDGPIIKRFLMWLYRGDYSAPNPNRAVLRAVLALATKTTETRKNGINDTIARGTLNAELASESPSEPADEPATEPAAEPETDEYCESTFRHVKFQHPSSFICLQMMNGRGTATQWLPRPIHEAKKK